MLKKGQYKIRRHDYLTIIVMNINHCIKNNLNKMYDSSIQNLTTILYPVFVVLIYLRKMLKKEDLRFRKNFPDISILKEIEKIN